MTRVLPTALFYVGFMTVVWLVILALAVVMPGSGMTGSAQFLLLLALFALVFCTRFAAWHFATRHTASLSGREIGTFALTSALGIWIVAMAFEAVFFWNFMSDVADVDLMDALFAPVRDRYTIPTVANFSFASCAFVVALIASVVFFPARTTMALHRSSKD